MQRKCALQKIKQVISRISVPSLNGEWRATWNYYHYEFVNVYKYLDDFAIKISNVQKKNHGLSNLQQNLSLKVNIDSNDPLIKHQRKTDT